MPSQKNCENACFISYKHPPNQYEAHLYNEFVKAFEKKLKTFLTTKLPPYHDDQLKLGGAYPEELSQKLCRSVCLVAVLTPDYPDSNWCVGEWKAMEKLESKRLGPGKKGLIIPVLLRGDPREWEKFVGERVYVDLRVSKPKTQLDSVKNRQKIEEIALRISEYAKKVMDPGEDCESFHITLGLEQQKPLPTLKDPDPLAR